VSLNFSTGGDGLHSFLVGYMRKISQKEKQEKQMKTKLSTSMELSWHPQEGLTKA